MKTAGTCLIQNGIWTDTDLLCGLILLCMPTDLFQNVTLCKYCMDEINDVMPSKNIGIIATGNANKCTNKQEDALY